MKLNAAQQSNLANSFGNSAAAASAIPLPPAPTGSIDRIVTKDYKELSNKIAHDTILTRAGVATSHLEKFQSGVSQISQVLKHVEELDKLKIQTADHREIGPTRALIKEIEERRDELARLVQQTKRTFNLLPPAPTLKTELDRFLNRTIQPIVKHLNDVEADLKTKSFKYIFDQFDAGKEIEVDVPKSEKRLWKSLSIIPREIGGNKMWAFEVSSETVAETNKDPDKPTQLTFLLPQTAVTHAEIRARIENLLSDTTESKGHACALFSATAPTLIQNLAEAARRIEIKNASIADEKWSGLRDKELHFLKISSLIGITGINMDGVTLTGEFQVTECDFAASNLTIDCKGESNLAHPGNRWGSSLSGNLGDARLGGDLSRTDISALRIGGLETGILSTTEHAKQLGGSGFSWLSPSTWMAGFAEWSASIVLDTYKGDLMRQLNGAVIAIPARFTANGVSKETSDRYRELLLDCQKESNRLGGTIDPPQAKIDALHDKRRRTFPTIELLTEYMKIVSPDVGVPAAAGAPVAAGVKFTIDIRQPGALKEIQIEHIPSKRIVTIYEQPDSAGPPPVPSGLCTAICMDTTAGPPKELWKVEEVDIDSFIAALPLWFKDPSRKFAVSSTPTEIDFGELAVMREPPNAPY